MIAAALLSADGDTRDRAARVREWKRGGLTAAEYAERNGLNARTLSSELGRSALAIARPPVVEVMVTQRSATALELILPSGVKVSAPVDFDEATLGRLVRRSRC